MPAAQGLFFWHMDATFVDLILKRPQVLFFQTLAGTILLITQYGVMKVS